MNMNISLTEELAALIREKVASGRYASANDVVREALYQRSFATTHVCPVSNAD